MEAHQGSPVPGILQARTLEWVAISSNHRRHLLCGGYIGWQSNCGSFIGNLSYWLLLIFSLSVQQGHHGMFRHGFMNSFCSGFGVLIHSDNSFLPFRKILRLCLFSLFLKLISDVCEISFYLLFLVSLNFYLCFSLFSVLGYLLAFFLWVHLSSLFSLCLNYPLNVVV